MYISKIIDDLDRAPRRGAETDEPEGARFIQISDTAAKELSRELRRIVEVFERYGHTV